MQVSLPRNQSCSETHSRLPPSSHSDSTSLQHPLPQAVSNPWAIVIKGNMIRQHSMGTTDFLTCHQSLSKMMIHLIPKLDNHFGQRQVAMALTATLAQAKLPSFLVYLPFLLTQGLGPATYNGLLPLWQAPEYICVQHT